MDIQRNILIAALLVVAYLLFLSWQQDYGNVPASTAPSVSAVPATAATATNTIPVAPGAAPTANNMATVGDIASLAPAATSPSTGDVPTAAAPATNSNRITVRTDVMDLVVDLQGGDIVSLTLPKFSASLNTPDVPVRMMTTGATTYIAQSGLVSTAGPDLPGGERSLYTADAAHFELAEGADSLAVVLRLPARDGVLVEKIFRFTRDDYFIKVSYRVTNQGSTPWSGFLYGLLKRDGSGDPSHPDSGGFFSATPTYLGGAHFSDEEVYNKVDFDDMQKAPKDLEAKGGWAAFIQHYFVGAWVPPQDQRNKLYTRYDGTTKMYSLGFSYNAAVPVGETREISAGLYAGPKAQDKLKAIATGLDLTVDYGWFWFISQPLFWLLVHIEMVVGNWGVAIILLTVLVKLAFFYPSHVSYRSMAHMRRVAPELTRIRDEYKNDRQKQSQEMLALYRKEKINPLGGCLPILIQMPVFLALYWVLMESVELRQAPFFLWIHDLSAMDPYFILPILMGISMVIQTRLNPAPPDPMQAKMMQWLPWIFTIFFLFFASGLVLYWLVNNILSIAQQWFITRQIEKQHAKA